MIDTHAALDSLNALVVRRTDQLVVVVKTSVDDQRADIDQMTKVLKDRFGNRVTIIFSRDVDIQMAVVQGQYDG